MLERRLMSLCFRLPEERQSLPIHLWRRFAFFPGGASRFADGHHEFGLLSRQFAPTGLSAAFPDFGEIFADFARQRDSFGGHRINVTGLRSISTHDSGKSATCPGAPSLWFPVRQLD